MELTRFIIGQLFGIGRVATAAYSYKAKSQTKNSLWIGISAGFYAAQYIALGFHTGAAVFGIAAARSLTFALLHKNKIKPKPWVLAAFTGIAVAAGVATWRDAWSLAPIFATTILSYGQWQKNPEIAKRTLTINNVIMSVCNFVKGAYADFAGTAFIAAFGTIKSIRAKRNEKRERKAMSPESPSKELEVNKLIPQKEISQPVRTKIHNGRVAKKKGKQLSLSNKTITTNNQNALIRKLGKKRFKPHKKYNQR